MHCCRDCAVQGREKLRGGGLVCLLLPREEVLPHPYSWKRKWSSDGQENGVACVDDDVEGMSRNSMQLLKFQSKAACPISQNTERKQKAKTNTSIFIDLIKPKLLWLKMHKKNAKCTATSEGSVTVLPKRTMLSAREPASALLGTHAHEPTHKAATSVCSSSPHLCQNLRAAKLLLSR